MKPHNILLIFSDEHDPRYMGCSGASRIRTPNLDRLAARGTRFTNAWTPFPICVPARASMATGRYVHQIGYWDNAIAYEGRITSWHHRLQASGLDVEAIGKLHFRSEADPTGFDRQLDPMHIQDGIGLVWGSVRDPLPPGPGRSPLFDELGPGESSYNRYDRRIGDAAVEWLETRAKSSSLEPWALFTGFVAPHMPLMVPNEYLRHYPLNEVALPKLMPRDGYSRHPWVQRMVDYWDHDAALGTDERRKLARACYLGLITYLDQHIGRIVDALERTGLIKSTRIIYTSDHGDNLGTRGLWNKCVLYRESTGVPMIVAGPGIPEGKVCATNVSLVDIYPTVVDGVGIKLLPEEGALAGRSIFQLAAEPDDPERVGFSEYHAVGAESGAFMLTRNRFKFHYYVGFPPELFDLKNDPEETRDLAMDPEYGPLLAQFERELRTMLDPEQVDRAAKTDQAVHITRFGGREAALKLGNKGATPAPKKFQSA